MNIEVAESQSPVDISIVVPCYNEQGNIRVLVERIDKALDDAGITWELILVDDGSADATAEIIRGESARDERVRGMYHSDNRGIVEGWWTGFTASRGKTVCTMDADLQYRPEDIPRLWSRMQDTGADLVQGCREEHATDDEPRYRSSRLFSLLLNTMFGMTLMDNKSGYILYKREAAQAVLEKRPGFIFFQHFPTVAAHALGYSIEEVSVVFDERYSGKSFIGNVLLFGLKSLLDFPLAIYRFKLVSSTLNLKPKTLNPKL